MLDCGMWYSKWYFDWSVQTMQTKYFKPCMWNDDSHCWRSPCSFEQFESRERQRPSRKWRQAGRWREWRPVSTFDRAERWDFRSQVQSPDPAGWGQTDIRQSKTCRTWWAENVHQNCPGTCSRDETSWSSKTDCPESAKHCCQGVTLIQLRENHGSRMLVRIVGIDQSQ